MKQIKFAIIIMLVQWSIVTRAQPGENDAKMIRKIYDESLINGQSYKWLHDLCFNIGHRLSGSEQAQKAVYWAKSVMDSLGFDKVYLQEVMVPHWVRGPKEQMYYTLNGKTENFNVIALGNSAGTPPLGIAAPIIEVKSLEELNILGREKVQGKIVFCSRPFDPTPIETFNSYGGCVDQRSQGPNEAAKLGALGCIVRSMTHAHDDFPHTGNTRFEEGVTPIPAIAISTKDADKLSNLIKKYDKLKFTIKLGCKTLPDVLSYNVIGEIRGSEFPNDYIITGGHLDSWDVGHGAHDDGAGCVQSMDALRLLKRCGIKPRHSIRAVLFMNEENGLKGALKYFEEAISKNENHILAIETDAGGFSPRGFGFENNKEKWTLVKQWAPLFEPYQLHRWGEDGSGADISPFRDKTKCLLAGLRPDSQRYFDYHHADSDTFDKVNRRELELGSAAIAALIYLYDRYGR